VTLEPSVAALVLFSAVLHASWNAIAKSSGDALLTMWLVTLTGSALGGLGALFVDFPHRDAWPYLAASVCLHIGYQLFLAFAYRLGDLSQVYPIARGLGPCVVAVLAAGFGGEIPTAVQAVGLAMASGAIVSLAFVGAPPGRVARGAVAAAVATGLLIGGYTFIDGQGVRLSGDPFDFIAWSFFLHAFPITIAVLALRAGRVMAFLRTRAGSGLAGGAMATLAYGIVLWALARGGMAQVAALRETGVIFAALIGTRLLGEPLGGRRVLAAAGVAIGVVLLES
jgi:drug/metabolite transporter (DMT)-like permease